MRYLVAMTVAVLLVAVMFAFTAWIGNWEKQFRNQGVALPPVSMLAIQLSYLIRHFWYVFVLLIVGCALSVALLWPSSGGH